MISLTAEAPPESPQKPALVRIGLQPDAVQGLHGKLKTYTAAKQQNLLAATASGSDPAIDGSNQEQLTQQLQVQ